MTEDNEGKLISQQKSGAEAEQELRATGEAFAEVKKEFFAAWMASAPRDESGREKLWVATTILTQVEKILRNRVANGKVAQIELDAIRKAGAPKTFLGIPV